MPGGALASQPPRPTGAALRLDTSPLAQWTMDGPSSRYTELKMTLHRRLLDMINLSVIDKMAPEDFRREIGEWEEVV